MIICPSCNSTDFDPQIKCKECGFSLQSIDGFKAWAPELAKLGGDVQPDFSHLASVEAGNFWFRSRNSLIKWALRKYFPSCNYFLEVGCGTGFVLSGLAKSFPSLRLVGSEIFTPGLHFAASRLPNIELAQMDARQLPYSEEFDVIGAFDVIEHIKEDDLVLDNFFRAIKPGGGCLITVPQHQWLWSPVDVEARHERRYGATDLHKKLTDAGFEIVLSTSFVTGLLPAMLLSRLLDKARGKSGAGSELQLNSSLNALFEKILNFELALIKLGIKLPIGGSRLVVARKVLLSATLKP